MSVQRKQFRLCMYVFVIKCIDIGTMYIMLLVTDMAITPKQKQQTPMYDNVPPNENHDSNVLLYAMLVDET